MNIFRKHPVVLWAGGLAFLAGSVSFGGIEAAGATSPVPIVTANQGAPAPNSSAWPVKGTVNVGNFPASQTVSGSVNVGNFPASQTVNGSVNVGNFPTSQTVNGTVNVGNEVQVAGSSSDLASETGHNLQAGAQDSTGYLDTSLDGAVKLYVSCTPTNPGDCSSVAIDLLTQPAGPLTAEYLIDSFSAADNQTVNRIETIPGPDTNVVISNTGLSPVTVSYALIGRTS